jgi:hypothetical protein
VFQHACEKKNWKHKWFVNLEARNVSEELIIKCCLLITTTTKSIDDELYLWRFP